MNLNKLFWVLGLMVITHNVWAYGSSSSSSRKICDNAEFSEFTPADKSNVTAGSDFSFKASLKINPDRIKVSIKDQPVAVTVTPVHLGYQVKGKLPESLQGAYARIAIKAEGVDKCQGNTGWLVNIAK